MDEKHRQYCIRLGNPYMREEQYKQQFNVSSDDSSWIPESEMKDDNWMKNSKKFTN